MTLKLHKTKMKRINKTFVFLLGLVILQQVGAQEPLSLSGALERAMDNNYGLKISAAGTEIAAINNNPGNAGRYPTVGFDASGNNNYDLRSETYSSRFSAGLGLNWVLFDGSETSGSVPLICPQISALCSR